MSTSRRALRDDMIRMQWLLVVIAGVALVSGCAGFGKSSTQVFTPAGTAQTVSASDEDSTTVAGYWAGVVPWELEGTDLVEVTTAAQEELYPGDGKFTQAVADIPFIAPVDARGTSSLAESSSYYYAENASPSEVQGVTFDPTAGSAFACYELALPSSAPYTIGIAWYSMPTDLDSYFIGIGDLDENVWHWYTGPDDGVLTFDPAEWGGLTRSSVLVCVALEDGKLADCWQLKAGVKEVRGAGLAYEEAPIDRRFFSMEKTAQSLPNAVDLSVDYLHAVRNQGSMGSCTAFACTDAALSILLNQIYGNQGWDTTQDTLKPSPMWAYVKSGISPIGSWNPVCGSNAGRYLSQAFNVLEQIGAAMDTTVPYYTTTNCSTSFPDEAYTEASLVQISDWYPISGSDLAESVKLQLGVYNRPVVIAMYNLEYSFVNYTSGVYVFNPSGGHVSGSHAMCIVGYDDSLEAFKVRNSWGTSWGQSGYWWCSYDSVDQMSATSRLYAYVMELEYNADAASHFLGVAPITIDEVEPNDFYTIANTLPIFPVEDFIGKLGGSDGADCYSFNHRAGYTTDFNAEITGSLMLRLELYDSSGNLLYRPNEDENYTSISGQWSVDGSAILKVQWLSGNGNYSLNANEQRPPDVPAGLRASDGADTDTITLRWNASDYAESYTVERADSENGAYSNIGTTFATAYTDATAEYWRYYYYRVYASNASDTSPACEPDQGSRLAPTPADVQASDGTYNDKVRVSWSAVTGNAVRYTIRRSISSQGPYTVRGTTTSTEFDDLKADDDLPYFYTVSASIGDFNGPASDPDIGYRLSAEHEGFGTFPKILEPGEASDLPGIVGPSDPGPIQVGEGDEPRPVIPKK